MWKKQPQWFRVPLGYEMLWTDEVRILASPDDIWEPETTAVVLYNLRPDQNFIDAGANTGWFSLAAAPHSRTVFAFEPYPPYFDVLSRNIERNQLTNVRAICRALGEVSQDVRLSDSTDARNRVILDGGVAEGRPVRMTRIDDEAGDEPVACMKIDVEGYEYQVLQGAERVIEQSKPVIVAEIKDNRKAWFGGTFKKTAKFLAARGYGDPVKVSKRDYAFFSAQDT